MPSSLPTSPLTASDAMPTTAAVGGAVVEAAAAAPAPSPPRASPEPRPYLRW